MTDRDAIAEADEPSESTPSSLETTEVDADSEASPLGELGLPRLQKNAPGAAPGIEHHELVHHPASGNEVRITCIDYSPDRVETRHIEDVDAFVATHRPAWTQVRWINVDGLSDMHAIRALAQKYEIHPLAVEDMLHLPQRPKVDPYSGAGPHHARLVMFTRMLQLQEQQLHREQITIVLGRSTVITFQESPGDVWNPIRERLNREGSRLRQNDASFLVYALLDAIVDHCFPLLETYNDVIEELDECVLLRPTHDMLQRVHAIKRELLLLRREIWPMRELVQALIREPHECMSETTRMYLRDVYDHAVQLMDLVETYRDVAMGLAEAYVSSVNLRMNEVIKVLTIISTIFIPLSFLAGVYGMNFADMPELSRAWGYPAFWLVAISAAGVMLLWFKRRGWLG